MPVAFPQLWDHHTRRSSGTRTGSALGKTQSHREELQEEKACSRKFPGWKAALAGLRGAEESVPCSEGSVSPQRGPPAPAGVSGQGVPTCAQAHPALPRVFPSGLAPLQEHSEI